MGSSLRSALARMYYWVYQVDSTAEKWALGNGRCCTLPQPARGTEDMHLWQVRCLSIKTW